jgi:hypothetical protein
MRMLYRAFQTIALAFGSARPVQEDWVRTRQSLTPAVINECALPREAILTQWLNEVELRDALLQRMPSMIGPSQLDRISRLERGNSLGNLRAFRADRGPVVGRHSKCRELPSNNLLLIFEVLIGRDQHLDLHLCLPEQIAVLQSAPAHFLRRADRVTHNLTPVCRFKDARK